MTASHPILDGLTEPQRQAVTHMEGPLLVVAGAGSGKTRVITRRVAHLVSQGVRPHRILAVTFTNKAAGEMRERIEALAGSGGVWVSTFHSLCAAMLRISADQLGLVAGFSIYDRDDQLRAVKLAMRHHGISTTTLRPASVLNKISNAKNQLLSPSEYQATVAGYSDELAAKVYKSYQEVLDANGAMDFDDLLMVVAQRLASDAAFRERWQQRFDYVLIDEYQDTNRAQYLIAGRLSAGHGNLCATGDADQAIYGWRGADIRNILDFKKDFPDAEVVKLEQNYRSTQVILDAANSLIQRNSQRHERGLWTENPRGEPVRFHLADDADDEADFIVTTVQAAVTGGRRLRDFAIFYRTNAQSRAMEEALVRASVPHRLVGAIEFYARQEIKDLLAFLRVVANERDGLSLLRIVNTPTRGLGAKTIGHLRERAEEQGIPLGDALAQADQVDALGPRARNAAAAFAAVVAELRAAAELPVAELCHLVLETTGYAKWLEKPDNEERRENISEFLRKAADYEAKNPEGTLATFLQEIALVSDVDNLDATADAITLMTLHAAKGLEFPVVFITGMEEGLLPHSNSIRIEESFFGEDRTKVEEERRLCYVGMTRAQQELVLTAAADRMQFNGPSVRQPSRFLTELSADVFDDASRRLLADAAEAMESASFDPYDSPSTWRKPKRKRKAPAPSFNWDAGERIVESLPANGDAEEEDEPAPDVSHFTVGDTVRHAKYGDGQILAIQRSGNLTLATLGLRAGGKRVFALEVAPLVKL